jgi:hypothetical protein
MRLPAITVIESASITPTPVHPNFQPALTPFDGHLTKVTPEVAWSMSVMGMIFLIGWDDSVQVPLPSRARISWHLKMLIAQYSHLQTDVYGRRLTH